MAALRLLLVASLAILGQACAADGDSRLTGLDVLPGPDATVDAGGGDPAEPDGRSDAPASAPHLVVTPAALEFEWVLLGETATRSLELANDGSLTLTLQPPTLVFATTPFVDLPNAPGDLFTIVPGGRTELPVRFAPTALFPPRNDPIAFVRLASNDPDTPQVDVPVYGRTTEATSPDLRVEPATLDLGTVPFGGSAYGKVTLWNQGDRELKIASIAFEEPDPVFEVLADPAFPPTLQPPGPFALQSGGHRSVTVRLDAAAQATEPGAYLGALAIVSDDPHAPKKGVPVTAMVALSPPCQLQLTTPSPVAFDATTTGCYAAPRTVRLENRGAQKARVEEVRLKEGCAPLFPYYLPEALPVDVPAGASWIFEVGFAPLVEGLATCLLTVRTAGCADQFLGVAGTGSLTSTSVETFLQRPSPQLDVLLVVDGSASMQPALQRLAADLSALFDALATSSVDAHLGLVAEDASPDCPQAATLLTTPRVLGLGDRDELAAAVAGLATGPCASSAVEDGLEAMRLALSHPLTTDLGAPCGSEEACPLPYACVDGGCGGANRGFLRPEASLRVLFVSDDDDASEGSVAGYVAFLEALKGPVSTDRADVYALAGDLPSGCEGHGIEAVAALRYAAVVEATGGAAASLCAPDYRGTLTALGTVVAPFQTVFVLAAVPVPETLHVSLDGAPCAGGWWFDPLATALVFAPQGPCMPPPGSTITVQYERLCSGG